MGQSSRLIRPCRVTGDGAGLVSHAGMAWLAETADLSGLTAGLSTAMAGVPQRRHDAGRTLAQVVLALADGATCLSDLAGLRAQPTMFGTVASEATVWRTFNHVGPVELRGIAAARAAARARAWAAGAGPAADHMIVDLDSTIIRTKADKQDAAPTYKRTFGHHPLLAMCAETDEVLAGMLRPGNAGANCAQDHVVVLAEAISQLPPAWQSGHRPGDDPPPLPGGSSFVPIQQRLRTGWPRNASSGTAPSASATRSTNASATASSPCPHDAGTPPSTLTAPGVTAPKSSSSPLSSISTPGRQEPG